MLGQPWGLLALLGLPAVLASGTRLAMLEVREATTRRHPKGG